MRYLLFLMLLFADIENSASEEIVPVMMIEIQSVAGRIQPLPPKWNELYRFFERELQVRFEISHYPFARLMQNLKNGQGLAFGISKNSERSRYLHFSVPIFESKIWIVTRNDKAFNYSRVEDFEHKTIGVDNGFSYGEQFDQQKNILFKTDYESTDVVSRIKKIMIQRNDAFLYDTNFGEAKDLELYLNDIAKQTMPEMLNNGLFGLTVLARPVGNDPIYFAILADKDNGIIARINQVMSDPKKADKVRRIMTRAYP